MINMAFINGLVSGGHIGFAAGMSKHKDPVEYLERVWKRRTNDIDILLSLAYYQFERGEIEKANSLSKQVLEKEPTNHSAKQICARCKQIYEYRKDEMNQGKLPLISSVDTRNNEEQKGRYYSILLLIYALPVLLFYSLYMLFLWICSINLEKRYVILLASNTTSVKNILNIINLCAVRGRSDLALKVLVFGYLRHPESPLLEKRMMWRAYPKDLQITTQLIKDFGGLDGVYRWLQTLIYFNGAADEALALVRELREKGVEKNILLVEECVSACRLEAYTIAIQVLNKLKKNVLNTGLCDEIAPLIHVKKFSEAIDILMKYIRDWHYCEQMYEKEKITQGVAP